MSNSLRMNWPGSTQSILKPLWTNKKPSKRLLRLKLVHMMLLRLLVNEERKNKSLHTRDNWQLEKPISKDFIQLPGQRLLPASLCSN